MTVSSSSRSVEKINFPRRARTMASACFDGLGRADHPQIDLPHARAIAQLEPGDGEQLRADRFFDIRLAHPDDAIVAIGDGFLLR